ncbi:uncharacterized protein LOC123314580 [Coccinella septempunctata]|uniref:uncharacterized protein LOC123314580 n=1 Tax=Coccinella septempunctata TaxID=41139 RepID=UPI001D081FA1|nr:uncharacterized protein LOC123314580 [Coccinella septempunctata]
MAEGGIRSDVKVAILTVAHGNFLFDEDEDEVDVNVNEKVENFAELIVPQYSDKQFQQHFRMKPSTFEDFLQKLSHVSHKSVGPGPPEIKIEKQAMITLWCLANMESFRSVGDRFGVTKSTCWEVLYRTCHRILATNEIFKIICWPTGERALSIMQSFQALSGLNE